MPIPLQLTFEDGTTQDLHLPPEVWAKDARDISRLFMTKKPVVRMEIDRIQGLADAERYNNVWPAEPAQSRFKLFKKKYGKNAMQKQRDWEEKQKKKAEEEKKKAEEGDKEEAAPAPAETDEK